MELLWPSNGHVCSSCCSRIRSQYSVYALLSCTYIYLFMVSSRSDPHSSWTSSQKLGREVGVPPPPRTDIYERDYAYGEDHPLHRNSKRPSIPSVIRTGSVGGMTPPGTVRTGPVPIPRARTSSFGGGLPGTVGSSPSMYNGGAGGSPYAAGAGLPYAGSGSPYAGGGSPYVGNGSPYQGRGSPYRAGGSPYLGGSAIGGGVVPPYAGSAGIPGAGAPYPGGSQMMAGQPGGVYPGPLPPGQYGYTQPGVVPCQVAFPPQGSMLMQGGNGVPYPTQGSMYAGSVGGGVIPGQVGSAYSASGMIPGTTAYAGGTMPGYSGSVGSVEGYPPGTIIIKPGRSRRNSSSGRHRHRHHSSSRHRHSSRSRSMEPPPWLCRVCLWEEGMIPEALGTGELSAV